MARLSHSAAGPAAGYLYQFLVALVVVLPYARDAVDGAVSVEVFDDVVFHDVKGRPKRAYQVNHSINEGEELLDTSAKLWRTLAIWVEAWSALDVDERRAMTLVTTKTAREGSAVLALTSRAYDLDKACARLAELAADEDGATGTAADRARFVALGPESQRLLLQHVTVADGQPDIVAIERDVRALLMGSNESRFVEEMATQLEGWWWQRIARALSDGKPIAADDVRTRIDEARRSLRDDALPVLDLAEFDEADLPPSDAASRRFLECLEAIAASDFRLAQALDDYRRAYAHRSRWGRNNVVLPQEIMRYQDRLLRAWGVAGDRMVRQLAADAPEQAKSTAGHDFWDRMESEIHEPLRPSATDGFIQSGSLHMLANDGSVAWHSDAVAELLRALVAERPAA